MTGVSSGWSQDLEIIATARATEAGQTAYSSSMSAFLTINAPPTGATLTASIGENAANGTAIGNILGVDPDGDTLTYTLLDNAGGRFTLSTNGQLAVADGSLLDFETAASHAISVRITDPFGRYIDRALDVSVSNVNEAPTIAGSYGFSVNENVAIGTAVGTVAASDPDGSGVAFGQLRYYFLNGGSASATSSDGRYAINATTGAITTNSALNFEAGTPSVAYTVITRDNAGAAGYLQASSTVTIGISDVNEAPAIPGSYGFSVNENVVFGTAVGTVAASDPDGAGVAFGQLRYYFLNGGTASATSADLRYTINATTGVITTNSALDFEAGSPSVAYTVVARDNAGAAGYNQTSSTVTIGINNLNEAPTIPASYGFNVNENVAIGTAVGTVAASDPDSSGVAFGQLRYYFLNGGTASATSSDGRYAINATTGAITTASALNYEAGSPSVAYTVVTRDNAGAAGYIQASSTVTIGINDLNEAPSLPSASFSVNENVAIGTAVGTVAATDPDTAGSAFSEQRYYFWNGSAASGTSADGRYAINAVTGTITTNSALNYEAGSPSVAYTVIARDNLGAGAYNQTSATVTIGIADVNEAPTIAGSYGFNVNENVAIGTAVGTVAGTDPDGAGVAFGQLRYYFLNGGTASATSSDGRYAIDAVTGAITTAAALNHEAGTPSVAYTVVTRDNAGAAGYNQASSTVTIGINDLNEAPAIPASYGFSVNENVAFGTTVGTVAATDPDSSAVAFGQLRYYFLNGGTASSTSSDLRYTINATTGEITTNSPLDFEAGSPSVAYTVVTRDNAGAAGYNQASSTVTIGINNLNEAPTIPASYGFSVNENVAIGTAVGTVAGTDPDSSGVAFGQLRYYFLNSGTASATSADGRYAINATTGAITTNSALNFEAGTPSVAYTVVTRDNAGAAGYIQASSTVTIGINNLNEAPSFPNSSFSVNENVAIGTAVGTVAATDPDSSGLAFGQLRYYFLNSGTASATSSDGRYAINAATGAITTNSALNFEAGTPSVAYTVITRDNAGAAGYNQVSSTVTIGINDLNEAPTIPASYGFSVNENVATGTAVGTVVGTDPDGAGVAFGQLRYYFLNGGTASATSSDGRYAINATTGAITTNSALNFEAGTPSVAYTVVTRDNAGAAGYNQASSTVTIGINNLNEAPTIPASYSFGVNENVAIGTAVGTVAGTDPDSSGVAFGQLRYYFLNSGTASATSADGRYAINATTGAITTNSALNYEAGTPSVAYTVVTRDNAGAAGYIQASSTVTIGINDLNEAPTIPASYGFSVNENVAIGTAVGTVAATDPDSSGIAFGQLRYYFLNSGTASATSSDGRYAINATTGAITTNSALNFEAGTPSVAYTVVARDNAGAAGYNQTSSTVTIGIADVNEAPTIPASYGFSVNENVAIGTAVGTVAASDPDGAGVAFGQLRYYFWNGSASSATSSDGRYAINATTGAITTNSALNFEAGSPSVAYTVITRDNAGAAGYNQASSTVTIGINNLNEAPTIPASYSFGVNENVAIGTAVGTVAASDVDGSGVAFGQLRYYFWNGSAATATSSDGRYVIDATTGAITTASALNYEAGSPSVAYTVVARDNAGAAGYNQISSTVTIGINDLNEAPTMAGSYGFGVNENVAIGTAVGTVAASDPDGSGVAFGQLRYYFWNGSAATATSSDGRYLIDAITGAITTAAALNYEAGSPSVAYTVVARDNAGAGGYNQTSSTVTIGINDLNEANSIPGSYSFGVNENVGIGTAVGTVAASDIDSGVFGQQRYYFWNGAASSTSSDGRYVIDAVTGAITTAAALNYEAGSPSVAYTVVARDNAGGGAFNQVSSSVTIGISNVNEAPSLGNQSFSVVEQPANPLAPLISLGWGDPDGTYANSHVFTIVSGDPGAYWSINNAGQISAIRGLNYEDATANAFTLRIRVTDQAGSGLVGGIGRDDQRDQRERSAGPDGHRQPVHRRGRREHHRRNGLSQRPGFRGRDDLPGDRGREPRSWERQPGQLSRRREWRLGMGHNQYQQWERAPGKIATGSPSGSPTAAAFPRTRTSRSPTKRTSHSRRSCSTSTMTGSSSCRARRATSMSTWTATASSTAPAGSAPDDGFLALDRNGDGTVTDMSEITFVGDSTGAVSDLEGLRAWDTDGDGYVDADDEAYDQFMVWQDLNQDGISQIGRAPLADPGRYRLHQPDAQSRPARPRPMRPTTSSMQPASMSAATAQRACSAT